MKSSKKTVKLPSVSPCLTIDQYLKSKASTRESSADALADDFILIAEKDIPVAQKANIRSKGFGFKVPDDLLASLVRLQRENRHLRSLSVTDELTGLYNKRFFNLQLTVEIARSRRTGEPFSLVFIDLDNFKLVNDTLGHAKGDEFLAKICRHIQVNIRPMDFACRFGGDEFAIILPTTSLRDAIKIAGRWHHLFLETAAEVRLPVSSSIGVDEFSPSSTLDAKGFIHQVDQLLYRAKKTGKGKIVHPEIEIPESKAVTWAEKEILYHIFQPSKKKQIRQTTREQQ